MVIQITIAVVSVIVVLIVVVLIVASTKPDVFRLQRSARIKAPPEKIFALLNDFHSWGVWSPWEKLDPNLERTYSGASSGKGAVYDWEGNKKVGKGRMEILESSTPSKMVIKLDFFSPFEAHNTTEFTLIPKGDSTEVNWLMYGPHSLKIKVVCVFMNMDKAVGKDFETGLANLKAATEQ